MELVFYTADVFTERRFCGNQLAVFPNAAGLDGEQMQAIAREFNLSETVFVFAPKKNENTKQLRIFTPGAEVPFAGHPTVGTACILAAIGEIALKDQVTGIVFEEGVGEVPVAVKTTGSGWFAELSAARAPEFRKCPVDLADVAAMVSLEITDLAVEKYPLEAVSCGLPFLFVPVRTLAAMKKIRLNQAKWETELKDAWARQLYLFTRETVAQDCDFHARMFAPALGITEDPATGSAATAFAGYLGRLRDSADGPLKVVVEQGLEMGRPSKMFISAAINAGQVTNIRVGGHTVLVTKGILTM